MTKTARLENNPVLLIGLMAISLLVADPRIYARLPAWAGHGIGAIVGRKLNSADATRQRRGYYDSMTHGDSRFASLMRGTPPAYSLVLHRVPGATRPTNDIRGFELVASNEVAFTGHRMKVNALGLRGPEIAATPAEGTIRVAVLGDSNTFGSGVADDAVWPRVLEEQLNLQRESDERWEVMNFAVAGYTAVDQPVVVEKKRVFELGTRILLYGATPQDFIRAAEHLAESFGSKGAASQRAPDYVKETVGGLGLVPGLPDVQRQRLARQAAQTLVPESYRRIADSCRRYHARCIYIVFSRPVLRTVMLGTAGHDDDKAGRTAWTLKVAADAGFDTIDLSHLFDEEPDTSALMVAPWDDHPNAVGHAKWSRAAYGELAQHERLRAPFD